MHKRLNQTINHILLHMLEIQTNTMPNKAVQTENNNLYENAKLIVENYNKIQQHWEEKQNRYYFWTTFGCMMTLIILSRF